MKIINDKGYTPNVLHFHGMNIHQLTRTFHTIYENHEVNNKYDTSRLKIVSTWTNSDACCLYQQCKRNNIELVNCVPDDYDPTQPWYMPNKIHFFIHVLENTQEEIVMFLDGYDVLLTHLDDVIERFESQPYHILFGPSCNNYPKMKIDRIPGRANKGVYCYFNAGCVIGYTKDLLKFYKESLQYIHVKNPLQSEQFILRIAYAKYSYNKNQNFIGVDFDSIIFQSMGVLDTKFDNNEVSFKTNKILSKKLLLIKDKIDIDDYFYIFSNITRNEVLETHQIKNVELLEYIVDNRMINDILFEISNRPDINKIMSILFDISNKYEIDCYFVFSKDFDHKKIEQIIKKFKSKYHHFIPNATFESVYYKEFQKIKDTN